MGGGRRPIPRFTEELQRLLTDYVGRPTPLGFAGAPVRRGREGSRAQDVRIYLKREDLCHTGAHKINNCIGQVLLARRMGKTRIIAETGAGQHGVATATACALFGLPCEVYMGAVDVERQAPERVPHEAAGRARSTRSRTGTRTLKDAMNEALRDWVTNVRTTHYVIGSVAGPHPYPTLVRELQAVIGREARAQIQEAEGRLPDALVACVGGGSNAIGLFHAFVPDAGVELFGVEAAGDGIDTAPARGDARARARSACCTARARTCCATTRGRSRRRTRSPRGSTIPGVGPEHAFLKETGRAKYLSVTDDGGAGGVSAPGAHGRDPVRARERARDRGAAQGRRRRCPSGAVVIVNVSGRGDKDMGTIASRLGVTL